MFSKKWRLSTLGALSICLLLNGCALHSTSRNWNGLVGESGEPTYYKTTTKVAFKLLIVIPFVGKVSIDGMVDDLTAEIAKEEGNYVRIVQAGSENYWHGYPPFSWIITPVISTVSAEYQPSKEEYVLDQHVIQLEENSWKKFSPTEL